MIQDEIESVIIQNKHVYKNIQRENFGRLNTLPQEWTPCEILDIVSKNGKDSILFNIPSGYKTVNPYSDSLSVEDLHLIQSVFQSNAIRGEGFQASCELCGHGVKNQFPIKNDSKKLLMWVGNVCVDTFMGAEYVREVIIKFKETKIRKIVNVWKPLAILDIWENPEFQEKHDTTRLVYKYWKFVNELEFKTNTKTLTTRKLINVLRAAKSLKINIPKECENMILTKKERMLQK